MSGRGRGRGGRGGWGWGRGGGFNTFASQAVTLPDVNLDDIHDDTKKLLRWDSHLQNYWEASPYFLEDKTSKKRQSMHIAKFSDRKKNDFTRDSLSQVLMFNDFPQELVQGASKRASRRKKFRWNPESEMKKLDFFEQQEKTNQGKEENDENEKKDGEDGDEDENAQEEDEEDISDDDYNQNIDFDDDEDDYNDVDDGDGIVTLLFQCISHFSFTSIILIQIQQLWQVYSTYQFFCSTTIFPLSQMNLPIRYQYGECSSAHPVTAIQAWTVAPLILQFGS
ncbi:hypothetical protein glysoja_036125 [Glycine soja]|uniref:Uncharacterized protein n=1 Tax=Glycine soja TaxID=3848 RepID=A0A0B2QBF9_GLYSO|nr:hypothetical protein glysoja_036125 [Glycine soja]